MCKCDKLYDRLNYTNILLGMILVNIVLFEFKVAPIMGAIRSYLGMAP